MERIEGEMERREREVACQALHVVDTINDFMIAICTETQVCALAAQLVCRVFETGQTAMPCTVSVQGCVGMVYLALVAVMALPHLAG